MEKVTKDYLLRYVAALVCGVGINDAGYSPFHTTFLHNTKKYLFTRTQQPDVLPLK